jgi:hypothetical protein
MTCPLVADARATRADWFHETSFEIGYLRSFLVTSGYALQFNQSNSYGQTLLRHIVTLRLAFPLPWRLYATVKAQVLVSKYFEPVPLVQRVNSQTFVSIEDENRNSVIVDLERAIGKTGVSVNARYSIFTNELGAGPAQFLRQVAYLGLTYHLTTR